MSTERSNRWWTAAEIKLLRKHYPTGGAVGCQQYIARSRGAIQNKAWLLCIPFDRDALGCIKLHREPHEWSETEDARIRALYAGPRGKGDVARLAEEFGVTAASVTNRARRIGAVNGYFWARKEAA